MAVWLFWLFWGWPACGLSCQASYQVHVLLSHLCSSPLALEAAA